MSGKQAKKVRREVTKHMKFNLKEIHGELLEKNIFERIAIAFKIIFKVKLYDPKKHGVQVNDKTTDTILH